MVRRDWRKNDYSSFQLSASRRSGKLVVAWGEGAYWRISFGRAEGQIHGSEIRPAKTAAISAINGISLLYFVIRNCCVLQMEQVGMSS